MCVLVSACVCVFVSGCMFVCVLVSGCVCVLVCVCIDIYIIHKEDIIIHTYFVSKQNSVWVCVCIPGSSHIVGLTKACFNTQVWGPFFLVGTPSWSSQSTLLHFKMKACFRVGVRLNLGLGVRLRLGVG